MTDASEAMKLSRRIQPLLRGHKPEVQSAVLADLLSIWLAGHWPPDLREQLLAHHVTLVRELVPVTEKQMFGPDGHPGAKQK
jgi:hypothetical protein